MTVEKLAAFGVGDIGRISVECMECKTRVSLPEKAELPIDAKCLCGSSLWAGNDITHAVRDLVGAVVKAQRFADAERVRFEVSL